MDKVEVVGGKGKPAVQVVDLCDISLAIKVVWICLDRRSGSQNNVK